MDTAADGKEGDDKGGKGKEHTWWPVWKKRLYLGDFALFLLSAAVAGDTDKLEE